MQHHHIHYRVVHKHHPLHDTDDLQCHKHHPLHDTHDHWCSKLTYRDHPDHKHHSRDVAADSALHINHSSYKHEVRLSPLGPRRKCTEREGYSSQAIGGSQKQGGRKMEGGAEVTMAIWAGFQGGVRLRTARMSSSERGGERDKET